MEYVSDTLDALADSATARAALKQHQCLRGIRGVPMAEVARVGDAVWREDAPQLPASADELDQLFGAAWEDGLVAIGLLAACWSDDPEGALDQGLDWATRIDDIVSADALGWFVLGPVAMVTQQIGTLSSRLRSHPRDAVRRCAIMAAIGRDSLKGRWPVKSS